MSKSVVLTYKEIEDLRLLIEEEILNIESKVRIWKGYRPVPNAIFNHLTNKKHDLLVLSKKLL